MTMKPMIGAERRGDRAKAERPRAPPRVVAPTKTGRGVMDEERRTMISIGRRERRSERHARTEASVVGGGVARFVERSSFFPHGKPADGRPCPAAPTREPSLVASL